MKRYNYKSRIFSSLLAFLNATLLICLAGCADDLSWNGVEVASDEYMIAFTGSSPVIETITGTRAADSERNKVSEVALIIFKDNKLSKDLYFTVAGGTITPESDGIGGSVTVKKRDVEDGEWYLVANANSKVTSYISSHSKDSTTPADLLGNIQCDQQQLVDGGTQPFVMVAKKDVNVDAAQTTVPVFMLDHIFSRVAVEMTATDGKFLMTGVKFDKYANAGTLLASKNNTLVAAGNTWVETPRTANWNSQIQYAKNGDQMLLASYPYKPVSKQAADNMFIIIKGHYNLATQADIDEGNTRVFDKTKVCYYAVPAPTLLANHKYIMSITSAPVPGKETIEEAIANPGGLSIQFIDDTERIRNIISDGKNVLAVCDTVRIAAKPDSGTGSVSWTLPVKARHADSAAPTVTLEHISGGEGWLTMPSSSAYPTQPITSTQESNNGLFSASIRISGSASLNKGSEREAKYKVKLNGTDLEREVVFLQAENVDMKYSDLFTINLKIERGAASTSFSYLPFINPSITSETGTASLVGIAPDENGGRVRNLGLHAPMPNGGNVKYTYTITLKQNGATVVENGVSGTRSGNTITYTFSDSPANYDYKVTPDAITISYSGTTYTLDLYHTGFFYQHAAGGTYYYYEVFTQNSNLHWLDRNMGAKSAGMGVRTGSGASGVLQSDEWPVVGDKAMGELYSMTEASSRKIPGWNIPSYAQLRSLTTLAGFNTERMTTYPAQVGYYAPAYLFSGTEGTKAVSIRSYFPQNMMLSGGAVSGDKSAGYYMTNTSAGTTNWYQIMQFSGMNVTSQNKDLSQNKVSVRLCSGSYNPSVEDTKYSCYVQGYTHVFLYYLNNDGSKTYLTTWPGEQIAVSTDIARFHPFEITPTMNYDTNRLYVIFNTVNSAGSRTNSNITEANVTARKGIKFVDGGYYDKNASTTASGAKEGNWVTAPEPVKAKNLVVRVAESEVGGRNYLYAWGGDYYFGTYEDASYRTGNKNGYRYWTTEVPENATVSITGVIFKNNASGDDGKSEHTGTTKILKETETLLLNEYDADILYTIDMNPLTDGSFYALRGNIFSSGTNVQDGWYDQNMTKKGSVYVKESITCKVGNFGIKRMVGSNQQEWISSSETNTTINFNAYNNCSSSGNNFYINAGGSYKFIFDRKTNKLYVVK